MCSEIDDYKSYYILNNVFISIDTKVLNKFIFENCNRFSFGYNKNKILII